MGKYMKKGKITGDVAVMEIPQPSSLGVRTRARTLALQPNPELSYLQLRSRRLEKPPLLPPSNDRDSERTSSRARLPRVDNSGPADGSHSRRRAGINSNNKNNKNCGEEDDEQGRFGHLSGAATADEVASFGENNLDFDPRERSTRESTPCSLIRDADAIATPGSTTRPTCSAAANRRARNMQRAIPTTPEMEEFFAGFELHQQESFLQKYNYDIVNDLPLPGRYEWVRVDN